MIEPERLASVLKASGLMGLSSTEARRRLRRFGFNEVEGRSLDSFGAILERQFKGALTWLLLAACVVSVALRQLEDALLIGLLLTLGGALAALQELHAQRTLFGLRSQSRGQARVLRDARVRSISALELVPGDIAILSAGDPVEADQGLLRSDGLRVLEHALTGESNPVPKQAPEVTRVGRVKPDENVPHEPPGAERIDAHCVFHGTQICAGWGIAEVFATGAATRLAELGKAAGAVARRPALLEEELDGVGKQLVIACASVVGLVALSDLFWHRPWAEVFLSGVSLAVAAVPESLPAVVNLALALGARALAREHVLVRELHSIEAAGAMTVICTGKTGILTADPASLEKAAVLDEPRTGVADAVLGARSAGVRTLLLTGDSVGPAESLAQRVGIAGPGDVVTDVVRAGASAADKLATIQQLQRAGHVVAMTGESTNNAPALRAADVGFALRESDAVTREASDMILLDNDFPHILTAIRLGRGIYDNIRKTIVYLMAGNIAELALMLLASLSGLPPPLSPLQLLWINLITDGPPAFALACDPIDSAVLSRPPRSRGDRLLRGQEWIFIAAVAALQALLVFGVFLVGIRSGRLEMNRLQEVRNRVFSLLVFTEVLWAFAAKDATRPFWRGSVPSNGRLLVLASSSVILQVAIGHLPIASGLFGGRVSTLRDFGFVLVLAVIALLLAEGIKRALAMDSSRLVSRSRVDPGLPWATERREQG